LADRFAHFLEAQGFHWPVALAELQAGRKESHWMWFIFPQLAGLGHSPMAQRFALHGLADAEAYLQHPVLGQRLVEATRAMLQYQGRSATAILGTPDDLKFHASMTLFDQVAERPSAFDSALAAFFSHQPHAKTLALLAAAAPPRSDEPSERA
jgi:uncharacterized protein (DUF1810 family)